MINIKYIKLPYIPVHTPLTFMPLTVTVGHVTKAPNITWPKSPEAFVFCKPSQMLNDTHKNV